MGLPTVSIVTISFNQGKFLEQAMDSVLRQDYPAIEYILVDPGSTDGSRDIIERYRNGPGGRRIAAVIYRSDIGPADGLNHGFAAASGNLFAYLNADDMLLPGAVSRAVRALLDTQLAVVHGDGYFIDAGGRVLRRCFSNEYSVRNYVLGGAVVMQQSSFWRREWHERVGGFNPENRTWWDGEFFFKIAAAGGRLRHVREYWSCFRIHPASITGSGRNNADYVADQRKVLLPHLKVYRERYGRLLPLFALWARAIKYIGDPRMVALRLMEATFRQYLLPDPALNDRN